MKPTNQYLTPIALSLLCGAAACAPRENAALSRAQLEVQTAKADPQLVQHAPTLMQETSRALARADREWRSDRDSEETEHLVYLTEQTLRTAREDARRKMAHQRAQMERNSARIAASDLRAEKNDALARAEISGLVAEHYRQDSEQYRTLLTGLQSQMAALNSRETERGLELTLSDNVLFSTNRSDLKAGAVLKLAPLTEYLKANPARMITIEGHTDNRGSDEHNKALSQARADAVRELFIAQGIEATRVVATGMGESFPLASNDSEAGRLQNRRVQIILSQPVR